MKYVQIAILVCLCSSHCVSKAWAMVTMTPVGDSTNTWADFSIWTGARISNPYTITGTNLQSSGTSADGYIELSLSSRYVLRSGKDADDPVFKSAYRKTNTSNLHLVNPFVRLPDMEGRIGYVFRGSESPTNFNANTVVGSSDFYAEYALGLPFFRHSRLDSNYQTIWKQQMSIELSGGFATDEDSLDLHPSGFFGIGWQSSYRFSSSTNRMGYWLGRVGVAVIDEPVFVSGTGSVVLNDLQEPKFRETWVPSMGAVVVYPITSSVNLQAGVNAYLTSDPPSSWNASLGISLDIDKFFSALK